MADLFVLLPSPGDESLLYAWRSAGEWVCGEARPSGHFSNGDQVVAFAPGTAVTMHRAVIPARRPAESRRLALFAVEDDVAEPVETLHIALGEVRPGGERDVLIASKADMRDWVDSLARDKIPNADILTTYNQLPQDIDAYATPDEILVRRELGSFSIDAAAPADLLRSLVPGNVEHVFGTDAAHALDVGAAGEGAADRKAFLVQLATWYSAGQSRETISLRQGDFSVRKPVSLGGLSRWRTAGALAAAALVLWAGSVWLETVSLRGEAHDLRARAQSLVLSAAPQANGNTVSAIEGLRQQDRSVIGAIRPTLAIAAIYEAIAPAQNAELRSLRYDAGSGRLTALVLFDDYADADAIGQRLTDSGLTVALGEARQSAGRVLGEFVVEAVS